MKVAAAQTSPKDGNIAANLDDHHRLSELAADMGAQLIVFPEMSLTGYQRQHANQLAFVENDARLDKLKALAKNKNIIIIAGAPIKIISALHIGFFILHPDGATNIYTKQFLHEGEDVFFTPCFDHNPVIDLEDQKISLAICSDISNPVHARNAADAGSTIYISGIFYTPNGIADGHNSLAGYAKKYAMNVLMSNYGGPSLGLESGGKSAFWTNTGELKGSLENIQEGILIASKKNDNWNCQVVNTR